MELHNRFLKPKMEGKDWLPAGKSGIVKKMRDDALSLRGLAGRSRRDALPDGRPTQPSPTPLPHRPSSSSSATFDGGGGDGSSCVGGSSGRRSSPAPSESDDSSLVEYTVSKVQVLVVLEDIPSPPGSPRGAPMEEHVQLL